MTVSLGRGPRAPHTTIGDCFPHNGVFVFNGPCDALSPTQFCKTELPGQCEGVNSGCWQKGPLRLRRNPILLVPSPSGGATSLRAQPPRHLACSLCEFTSPCRVQDNLPFQNVCLSTSEFPSNHVRYYPLFRDWDER